MSRKELSHESSRIFLFHRPYQPRKPSGPCGLIINHFPIIRRHGTDLPHQSSSADHRRGLHQSFWSDTQVTLDAPELSYSLVPGSPRQLPFLYDRNVGILKKLFPKIQFICATHSPFIIQLLEEGELITLDHPLESDYSGDGIEDIAEDVMGVEMPQYSEKKRKMYEAAEQY